MSSTGRKIRVEWAGRNATFFSWRRVGRGGWVWIGPIYIWWTR